MTRDQRRVITDIHDWLTAFVQTPIPKSARSKMRGPFNYYEITENRLSNVILIDGGRGSGKTSILVTMLELWLRAASGEQLSAKSATPPGATTSARGTQAATPAGGIHGKSSPWNRIVRRLKRDLEGRLIPIQPLDLQPLPPFTSLLPWLANSILALVNSLEDPSGKRAPSELAEPIASWQPDWKRELPSRLAWKKLIQCAALGWNSNLPDRMGALDPDSYAVELDQAERARLSMVAAWRELAATVVADAHRLYPDLIHEDARIVIPIDDADMNPHRCVELLELMRSLWSPHVVFVLTGHSKLFLKTLQIHYLKLFRQPLGPATLAPQELTYVEASPNARSLARQVYDKVIPLHHRFGIKPLGGPERLKLLKDLLQAPITKDADNQRLLPKKLAGYFKLSPVLQQGLPHRLRRILNIRQALTRSNRAGALIQELWQDAIHNSEMPYDEQRALKEIIQLGSNKELRVVVRGHFTPDTERLVQMFRTSGIDLQVNVVTGYSFESPQLASKRLPYYLAALLQLAANAAADERAGRFPQGHPAPRGSDYPLFVSHVPLASQPTVRLAVHWPIPDWQAPVDFSIFDNACVGYLVALNDIGISNESWHHSLVNLYLSGVLGVGLARKIPRRTAGMAGTQPVPATADSWRRWVRSIVKKAHARERHSAERVKSLRERAFQRWLSPGAILIAAPEYGLPPAIANEILATWLAEARRYRDYEGRLIEQARQARHVQMEAALRGTSSGDGPDLALQPEAEDVLKEIDAANPEFRWAYLIGGREEPSQTLAAQLEYTLGLIRVEHDHRSTAKKPDSLDEYLTLLDVKPFFPMSSERQLRDLESSLRRYTSAQGVAPHAVMELWNYVLATEPMDRRTRGLAKTIQPRGEGIQVNLPGTLQDHLRYPLSRRRRPQVDIRIDGGFRLRIFQSEDWAHVISPLIQGMIQTAHDVAADENDVSGSLEKPGAEWKTPEASLPQIATLIQVHDETLEVNWPVPRWNTFLDGKLMDDVWRQIFRHLSAFTFTGSDDLLRKSMGAIVHSLLSGLMEVCDGREANVPRLDFRLRPETLSLDGMRLHELARESRRAGTRFERIREWAAESAVLLAAPETGLSPSLAAAFLKPYFSQEPATAGDRSNRLEPDSGFRQRVRKMRRERIRFALEDASLKLQKLGLLKALREIDNRSEPDHPWFEAFGKDSEPTPHEK